MEMGSKFNFGKRLRVTRHEYRKMNYGAALRWDCSCENRLCQKGGTLPLTRALPVLFANFECPGRGRFDAPLPTRLTDVVEQNEKKTFEISSKIMLKLVTLGVFFLPKVKNMASMGKKEQQQKNIHRPPKSKILLNAKSLSQITFSFLNMTSIIWATSCIVSSRQTDPYRYL